MGTADGSNCGMIFYEADQNSHAEASSFRLTVSAPVLDRRETCRLAVENEKRRKSFHSERLSPLVISSLWRCHLMQPPSQISGFSPWIGKFLSQMRIASFSSCLSSFGRSFQFHLAGEVELWACLFGSQEVHELVVLFNPVFCRGLSIDLIPYPIRDEPLSTSYFHKFCHFCISLFLLLLEEFFIKAWARRAKDFIKNSIGGVGRSPTEILRGNPLSIVILFNPSICI